MPPKKAVAVVDVPNEKKGPAAANYSPEMIAYREKMLRLYPTAKKINGGGFSEIFALPHNQLLRIGLIGPYNPGNFTRAIKSCREAWERTNRSGVSPKVQYVDNFPSKWSESKPGMLVSVIDRVTEVVPFKDIGRVFASDVEMAKAMFAAADKLEKVGVIHGDPSPNNVLVRANGDVVFIDLDDMCLFGKEDKQIDSEVTSFFCKRIVGYTPGYTAPENELPPAKKSVHYAYLNSVIGRKQSMYAGLIATVAAAYAGFTKVGDMKAATDATKYVSADLKPIVEWIMGPIGKRPTSARDVLQRLQTLSSPERRASISSVYYSAELPQKKRKRASSVCGDNKVQNPETRRCIAVGGKVYQRLCKTVGCPS